MDPVELLQRYEPLLVILPRDPKRRRPWSRWPVQRLRGDYHPCSAEFFLSFVTQRVSRRAWSPFSFLRSGLPPPTGLAELKKRVAAADDTEDWEIDLAPMKSQDADQAWTAYGAMLEEGAALSGQVVYGRYVHAPRPLLQYWYLYPYNDAPNRHEGDWELVTVELDGRGEPLQAGCAAHAGGSRRPWQRVEKRDGRPLIYVARGSHASYFEHRPGGHRTASLAPRKGLPEPLDSAWSLGVKALQDVMVFLRLQDRTPVKPVGGNEAGADTGEFLDPRLVLLPSREEVDPAAGFWWMRLDCPWGSSHFRFTGSAAPYPPWMKYSKWEEPAGWLDDLPVD